MDSTAQRMFNTRTNYVSFGYADYLCLHKMSLKKIKIVWLEISSNKAAETNFTELMNLLL